MLRAPCAVRDIVGTRWRCAPAAVDWVIHRSRPQTQFRRCLGFQLLAAASRTAGDWFCAVAPTQLASSTGRARGPAVGQGCIGYLKSLSAIAVTVTSPGAAAARTAASDSQPYLGRQTRAAAEKVEMGSAARTWCSGRIITPILNGLVAHTVDTVRFTRPTQGPVPHVVDEFTLTESDSDTWWGVPGEPGTDLWDSASGGVSWLRATWSGSWLRRSRRSRRRPSAEHGG
jgi:hypothetical protein